MRADSLEKLKQDFDLIIIGGGITGAGVALLATQIGLKTILLEQRDFAWGTSSRSGKLVHGGLRYLKQGHISLTKQSVQEREELLRDAKDLVEPLRFILPCHNTSDRFLYGLGLTIYDFLAKHQDHKYQKNLKEIMPELEESSGYLFHDAKTDDAKLVLSILLTAEANGATLLNYAKVLEISNGHITFRDEETEEIYTLKAKAIINATGAWVDKLRKEEPLIRPLRGSHLILKHEKVPIKEAVSFLHPQDHRPLYIFPWQGTTLLGTTDVDHHHNLNLEPSISLAEKEYLLSALAHIFPSLQVSDEDILSTFAGIRGVVGTGKKNPSEESREVFFEKDNRVLHITGGKLTTFRLVAYQALKRLSGELNLRDIKKQQGFTLIAKDSLKDTHVVHLDDFLLRRTRIGLVSLDTDIQQFKAIFQKELGFDETTWQKEVSRYNEIIKNYRVPH